MADHNILGQTGEDMAVRHIKGMGYQILERNWRYGREEIDIIAKDGDMLVIIEVKSRTTTRYGEPEFFVTAAKRRILIRAAEAYILKNDLDIETRFDIISVVITPDKKTVHHIEDAFYPTL
ncbi:MAG: YraN family protein [Bacteroidales bacterium]|jgi:putative endonuclease|nr:YraN family protein [Bacteroidales bacterium]MCK9448967.1 YraN family protein [Bacteroidales bacterium]MDD3702005.1 YraN family protein [Bacteroidales bacterium]MDY0368995.1 YraN family protein [Bacteroidales bacterium]